MSTSHESLERIGIFFDDLNKIKIVHPTSVGDCQQLEKECGGFTASVDQLQQVISKMVSTADELAKQVESNKMKAIGTRNALETVERTNDAQKQQLMAVVTEKTMQLDRYRRQLDALKAEEQEQQEQIQQFLTSNR